MRTGLRRAGLGLLLVLGRTDRLRGVAAGRPLSWAAEHRGALQWAVVALGGIVLFAWDPPTARVVLIDAALVIGGIALIAVIAGLTRAPAAPASAPPAAPGSS